MKSVVHYVEYFVPENYELFLDINRKEKIFSGRVTINGVAKNLQISLHQKNLTITSVKVAGQDVEFQIDDENEAVHISLQQVGEVTLELVFSGQITDNMTGMYPSYYTFEGEKKELVSTQFESHFAREVFPSVDEPEAKATFDLSLKFDQEDGDIALSNMPEIKVDERKRTGIWTFDTTPRMSSYLLAFVLGALHGKTVRTKNGTLVGSYASQAQKLASLDFSLDIAVRVIEFYEDYFQVNYPIPQCLHVALPDFSAGAMENWGLITYREVYLLVDENSSVVSRQQVALVIAHEVAHQWFGNLVTMKWWDDLWLNESFANMMEYVAIDAIEPSWNIFRDFQISGIPHALRRDATDGVQSVHVEVKHPDEINTLFDAAIVYAKGSRLMHMLRRWLGESAFSTGLKSYFDKHQYGNTIGQDLWDALSAVSNKDVADFMNAWLEQPGYPRVTAKVEEDKLILSQKQFFIGEHENKGRLWPIPLNSNWTGLPENLTQETLIIENLGVNTILTPVWTPPLDTAVGSYRTPVQLVGITRDQGRWSFDFSRLRRWMSLCRSHGMTTLEISHFFTQWGATATPTIHATVDGQARRIFGWDVPADDPRYREFLQALIPELLAVLADDWGLDRVCFHISDEPNGQEQLATYRTARDVVAPLLRGLRMIDALSDLELYTQGLVQTPVVANTAIEPFLRVGAEPLWTYYCVAQQLEVSNRFITLPSVRNRVLAPQIYKERVQGFLHWGFNFYYSELSARLVDPFRDTTAGGAFPGGDAFIVYPGEDGAPLESIRYRVLAAAMADLRAMALLERLAGRARVLEIIDPGADLAFDRFSYDADAYRRMREEINAAIMEC